MISKGCSSELRKGRVSQAFASYSITKVVLNRRPVLATDNLAQTLVDSWNHLRNSDQIKLFAFCIMPDHYHMAFCLMPGSELSAVMESTNKFSSREINKRLGTSGQFWQEGFRDRNCRDQNELFEACAYIEHNPVRAGLAESAALWPYSSAAPVNRGYLDREWWP